MDMVQDGFDASTFSRNRERLLRHDVAAAFFEQVVQQAKRADLMSAEHFSVDGTLIEAWASMKRFRPKSEEVETPMPGATSVAAAAATKLMSQRPTRSQDWHAKETAVRPSCASADMA